MLFKINKKIIVGDKKFTVYRDNPPNRMLAGSIPLRDERASLDADGNLDLRSISIPPYKTGANTVHFFFKSLGYDLALDVITALTCRRNVFGIPRIVLTVVNRFITEYNLERLAALANSETVVTFIEDSLSLNPHQTGVSIRDELEALGLKLPLNIVTDIIAEIRPS